ncbi:MAG TPA: dTDP-4-dehydrorhamnose reductase [Verrucomicrobiae bacterium]|jgi:dTDP-4-dehydrorhamnose reductase|nr:dTDP-4-dehydrorhamnose reductase [Verrucomicrobiae bacterium]
MQVLVIGAAGLLGRALLYADQWVGDHITGAGPGDADIRDQDQVEQLFTKLRPDWTVLTAAYTDVDGCEKDPERAHQVNCAGAIHVARSAQESGSKLLFLSTDYVFDGCKNGPYEPEDAVAPLNVYGHSKAQAEDGIRRIIPEACILRTSWLFGATGRCFPNTILELAQTRKNLTVVADQTGCPTFNRDLAKIIAKLVRAGARGTIHATNAGQCNWYEFACETLRAAGVTGVSVSPVSSEDFPRPARRPGRSVLSGASLTAFSVHPRHWKEALGDYLRERSRAADGQELTPRGTTCD